MKADDAARLARAGHADLGGTLWFGCHDLVLKVAPQVRSSRRHDLE